MLRYLPVDSLAWFTASEFFSFSLQVDRVSPACGVTRSGFVTGFSRPVLAAPHAQVLQQVSPAPRFWWHHTLRLCNRLLLLRFWWHHTLRSCNGFLLLTRFWRHHALRLCNRFLRLRLWRHHTLRSCNGFLLLPGFGGTTRSGFVTGFSSCRFCRHHALRSCNGLLQLTRLSHGF